MAVRYIIKNNKGKYINNVGSVEYTSKIENAVLYGSKKLAKALCWNPDDKIIRVDVQITELN